MTHPISVIVKTIDDKEPAWPEAADKSIEGVIDGFCILENGTASGKASAAFKIELPDGTFVLAQLTQGQFEMLFGAFQGAVARFEDLKIGRQ